jgi:sulfide:quinone oxidoreductase
MKKILILGGGFGGLETATGLAERMGAGYEITLVDKNESFFIGFSKIDVLFGRRSETEVRYRYENLRAEGVRFVRASIEAIDTDGGCVATSAGSLEYDYLVVALGADLDYDAPPGFRESGAHEFYSMEGVRRLRPVIDAFDSGTLVLGILGVPYKCPPAPYEVIAQLHERFIERGVREHVRLQMVIPGVRPVPNPKIAGVLEELLAERAIELVPSAPISSIDAASKALHAGDRSLAYDLFVGVPIHVPPAVVRASGLGEGFIKPRLDNLETAISNVYAVGDVTTLPAGESAVPKAGAFAQDAARTVVSDILMKEGLASERLKFEARGTCYFEVGDEKVGRISANFFGGDEPSQEVDRPGGEHAAEKRLFEEVRRDRWFRQGGRSSVVREPARTSKPR